MAYRRINRTRRGRGRRSGSVRQNIWVRSVAGVTAQWSATGVDLIAPTFLDPGARVGATVTRVRGVLFANVTDAAPEIGAYISVGLVVSEVDPNFATQPAIHPIQDANSVDWLYWEVIPWAQEAAIVHTGGSITFSKEFDVKAMRRINAPNQTLNLYIANSAGTWMSVNVAASTLLKLS